MDPAVARALTLLQHQVRNLEKRVSELQLGDESVDVALPGRYANMFSEIPIENNVIAGSPLLLNLYQSESLILTEQCVGTWPDNNLKKNAVCLYGGETLQSGQPCEQIRLEIIPELIKHQVPFSTTHVDKSESVPINLICQLFKQAPSHLIIDVSGSYNFEHKILEAYLLGRGHSNIHKIKNRAPQSETKTVNLLESETFITNEERLFECERLLLMMSPTLSSARESLTKQTHPCFAGTDDSFFNTVLNVVPDSLQKHNPQTVANRRACWNDVCEENIVSDMGHLVASAYLAGMLSPKARGSYTPVPKTAIANANEWLGKTNMYCKLASVLQVYETGHETNDQRDAIQFFAALLNADMSSE